jgi:tetratricopeptide (TPR) repeat protein
MDHPIRRRAGWVFPGGLLFLILLTAFVYLPVWGASFIPGDDDAAVTNNPHLQSLSMGSLRWMFTDIDQTMRYEPMAFLVWAILYRFVGLSSSAFHALNLGLHLANTLLVALAMRQIARLCVREAQSSVVDVVALLGAAVWALHPMRTEVVGWVTQACFAEATAFTMISLLFYLQAVEHRPECPSRTPAFAVSALAFFVGALFFPNVVGYPVALLLVDVCLLRPAPDQPAWRPFVRSAMTLLPYFLVTALVSLMTLYARLQGHGAWPRPPTLSEFPLFERLAQGCYVLVYYLWKPFDPTHISPIYTNLVNFQPAAPVFLMAIALTLTLSLAAVLLYRRHRWLLALWGCHVALLLPMAGLFDKPHFPSDRYAYLQAVLLSGGLCLGLLHLLPHIQVRFRPLLLGGSAVAVLALAPLSWALAGTWRTAETSYRHILAELGDDPYRWDIQWRLARVYVAEQRLDEAIELADASLQAHPQPNPQALEIRGNALMIAARNARVKHAAVEEVAGRFRAAADAFLQAASFDESANDLLAAADCFSNAGDVSAAQMCLLHAAEQQPSHPVLPLLRAQVLFQEGQIDNARQQLQAIFGRAPEAEARITAQLNDWTILPAVQAGSMSSQTAPDTRVLQPVAPQ